MHLVASSEYLLCADLCPSEMSCLDVDCDLTVEELEVSGGYGYVAFVAYNIEAVTAVEFYVVGWPLGPETPDFVGPTYCAGEAAYVWLEPFEKRGGRGGMLSYPWCEDPCSGMFCFCTIGFGPEILDWLPITLKYSPSTWTYSSGQNFFIDCTASWIETVTYHEHYAVIGGECEPIPNCEPGPTGSEGVTWGAVKSFYR